MKRFLTLTLGVALLAAAPLSAQSAPSDKAAALLQKAQEAAAHGQSAKAAEYARAAAEVLMAQQGQDAHAKHDRLSEHVAEVARNDADVAHVHAEIAKVAADVARGAFEVTTRILSRDGTPIEGRVIRMSEPNGGDPYVIVRQEPAGPSGPVARKPAGPSGPTVMRMRAPQAPHAPENELSLTMKLIHAEVQALRAEVQAMRAELALARLQGGASHAAAPMSDPRGKAFFGGSPHNDIFELAAPGGTWHEAAPDVRRKMIFIGPGGEVIEHGDLDLEWTEDMGVDENGFEFEIEDHDIDELRALGYSGGGDDKPKRLRLHFGGLPTLEDVFIQQLPAAPATPATPATPTVRERPNRPDRPQR
ncbi:MAG: hypothetical protein O3A20_05385 [Planctomycetota bacterium]|nr:hypothetical protein [Planctomycetota bacterium]